MGPALVGSNVRPGTRLAVFNFLFILLMIQTSSEFTALHGLIDICPVLIDALEKKLWAMFAIMLSSWISMTFQCDQKKNSLPRLIVFTIALRVFTAVDRLVVHRWL